jgi:hypothetical protein
VFKLNLPAFETSLRKQEGKVYIFDNIRKKYVVLTPEEWVRQHFINFLIHHLHYPRSLFKVESSLTYNRLQKRSDILVRDRSGNPWMLVECKSPEIKLTQAAINQVSVYNKTIGARYVAITNGLVQYCFDSAESEKGKAAFLDSFPEFPK